MTAVTATAVSVPLTVTKHVEQQKTNNCISLSKNTFTTNYKLNSSHINFEQMLQKTNLQSVDKYINNQTNNLMDSMLIANPHLSKTYQQNAKYRAIVKEKAYKLSKLVFEHKISMNTLIKNNIKKFNNLPENKRQAIEQKIHKYQEQEKKLQTKRALALKQKYDAEHASYVAFSSPISLFSNNSNNKQSYTINEQAAKKTNARMKKQLTMLAAFAGTMTAAAAASYIIAAAQFTIPFWGWFVSGPITLASAVADTAAAAMGWVAYKGINNIYAEVSTFLISGTSVTYSVNDIFAFINDLNHYKGWEIEKLPTLQRCVEVCLGVNDADAVFNLSSLEATVAIDVILTFLDLVTASIGIASTVIAF
ncbi:hypothetical protein [Ureaplasma ceti]|uniref:Transmembrane protein n=1 Tax=Ureaplasma ceti TaxID=3119530 RepID=A0ABP9U8W3_9BACT